MYLVFLRLNLVFSFLKATDALESATDAEKLATDAKILATDVLREGYRLFGVVNKHIRDSYRAFRDHYRLICYCFFLLWPYFSRNASFTALK